MNKTSLLELAKKLNIPRRNCMKIRQELEEAIKDTITRYKQIIFGLDTPTWDIDQQVIDQNMHVHDQRLMDDTERKLAREGLQ